MTQYCVKAGYMPLVDAAPLIVAKELGFANEEGLRLDLQPAPSWSTLRDRLLFGQIQAAHMLAPVPIASAIQDNSGLPKLVVLSGLSSNGNVFGVSKKLRTRLRANGLLFDFENAKLAGDALADLHVPLKIGVPFALSMHAELVTFWLTKSGLQQGQDFQIIAVPPPLMAQAMQDGILDAFCVGEPWGSVTVATADAGLMLPSVAIWSNAPEKVLSARDGWVGENPECVKRLMRAVWRAGEWLANPDHLTTTSEVLARSEYLGIPAETIDCALWGRMIINQNNDIRTTPNFLKFNGVDTCFPWKSRASWIAERLANRLNLDPTASIAKSREIYRSDLYRENLGALGADLPLSSSKIEGALDGPVEVSGVSKSLILNQDQFFDGTIYDPGQ
ncbi:CmpA/NrtA family ABC transporter substrate-binding protein [Cognatishimia sp. WU-CL00825]|uniref:ABC transporter substrate-binding protein n=1 Tax=Cognatishimia sp. WU-CL00825 TaxID=3127658 RepID=UPI00310BCBB1